MLGLFLAAGVVAPTTAAASRAALRAGFAPERLGASTTIAIDFRVGQSSGPLTGMELRLPDGVTNGFNTLGEETCTAATLQTSGPGGCSPNALVGRGHAEVNVPIGSGDVGEPVTITVFMAPTKEEHTTMLFYASGISPVISQLVFESELLGDSGVFGAKLDLTLPPLAGLPGSPDAALVSLQTQIGPKDLKYYKRVHGVTVSYSPEGFDVPARCPRGGFPFAAMFTFANGASESASTRVPCPAARSR